MDGFDAVIDQPEIGAEEVVQEAPEQQTQEQPEQQPGESDNKFSKRFSDWLKTTRDTATDPEIQKFARYGKDLEGRDRLLRELYPEGVSKVREVKAILDGLEYGEAKGVDAISAIQDQIRDYEQSDELLASGSEKVWDLFGPEFDDGLAKLAPSYLNRLQQSKPEAYSETILPHLVSALRVSPLVSEFNGIVDVLNQEPPAWLTPDQKTNWINDKLQNVIRHANGMASWLNAQDQAVKGKTVPGVNGRPPQQDQLAQERQQFETERQNHYWQTNIVPELNKHAEKSFNELLAPYDKRLKLSPEAKADLAQSFVDQVKQKATANRQYMSQIGRYRSQPKPDAAVVTNLARVEWDKHAKGVMEGLIDKRYRTFLGQQKMNTQAPRTSNGTFAPANGPKVVSVRPPNGEIDFQNTPTDWLMTKADGSKQFRMKDGSIRIFRPNR